MPRTDPPGGLYPLLVATAGDGREQRVHQGTAGRIGFADAGLQAAFVDLAAIGPRPVPASLGRGAAAWRLDFTPAPGSVAVVGGAEAGATDPTVGERLELARDACASPGQRAGQRAALEALGLAALAPGARLSTLGWRQRVELDFIQAWLQEPEWLLFDRVFDHPESGQVQHLPEAFHRRFPLRAISFLGQCMPDLPGAVLAPTLHFPP